MTNELLTVDEMATADRLTIEGGTPGLDLMEVAGRAVAEAVARHANGRQIFCLCGPGNNGGDGYVAARILNDHGADVSVVTIGDPTQLADDARTNYERWDGKTVLLNNADLKPDIVIVDALFGAGLQRDIDGEAAKFLNRAKELQLTSIAADLPSGVNGDTGKMMGTALPATETVTFFRKKPGHLLFPGRELCGALTVVDIGIPASVLNQIKPQAEENLPSAWFDQILDRHNLTAHKYDRGHVLIFGGAEMTGAARLAARGARRAGAGLVTISVPASAIDVYRTGDPGNIVELFKNAEQSLADPRRNTIVVGPGMGNTPATKKIALSASRKHRTTILDADALNVFSDDREALMSAINGPTVLTPHEGEFARLFDISGSKLERAKQASAETGAIIVLKGADTVVASPDGRATINASAPPWLGTAGAGDVLAGVIGGFAAQGALAFEAASAGVWCHGAAAASFGGPGLIAEDLPALLPNVLHRLYQQIE